MDTPEAARKKAAATYNAAADSYDHPANSFWDRYGRRTVDRLRLRRGSRVLDVCLWQRRVGDSRGRDRGTRWIRSRRGPGRGAARHVPREGKQPGSRERRVPCRRHARSRVAGPRLRRGDLRIRHLLLEAGCGVGAQTLTLARNSPEARITCVGLSSAASLAEAKRAADAAGLTSRGLPPL